jgi:hypothetical protein
MALSKDEKKYLWIGLGTLVVVGGLAIALKEEEKPPPKKKDYGIEVDPQCNQWNITSEGRIRDAIREETRTLAKKGAVDPFDVARNYLNKAAPNCTTFPENTRNPGEAALFIVTLNTSLDVMMEENLLSEGQSETFRQMAQIWGLSQGISPDEF